MSVLTDTRCAYLRQTTNAFINDQPVIVNINRQVKVAKPGGGHDFTRVAVNPQVFRFINQDMSGGITYGADDGIARRFSYALVGRWDADVDINDIFTVNGIEYKVDSIVPNNGWESRAYVTAYSLEPENG